LTTAAPAGGSIDSRIGRGARSASRAFRLSARAGVRATATAVLAALCCAGWPAAGAAAESRLAGIEVQLDNDQFAAGADGERWYTNGTLVRMHFEPAADGLYARFARAWCGATTTCDAQTRPTYLLGFGQLLYTPAFAPRTDPQPWDWPYSAWLYVSSSLLLQGPDTQQTLGVTVGITGPAALGEQVQNIVHRILQQAPTGGWDYQLRPRLGVQLDYSNLRRHGLGVANVDLVRRLAATVGNIEAGAGAGALLRWGQLPDAPTFPGEAAPAAGADLGAWYVFAGADARWVARNQLIDGQPYGYTSLVTHEPFVWDVFAGVSLRLSAAWRLDFSVVQRSREFDTPFELVSWPPFRYGSVVLRWAPSR
jgi:lipid A 3-O-deacylase